MAMNMRRAFNSRMLTKVDRYVVGGSYDDDNVWIPVKYPPTQIKVVNHTGNQFSQFDVGVALKATESGERFSDYRSIYVNLSRYSLDITDKIGYEGNFYNIIQQTKEDTFGFRGFLIERSKNWSYP